MALSGAVSARPTLTPSSGQVSANFSAEAGGKRSYYVVLPAQYSKRKKYRLVLVFPGTDTTGRQMHEWLGEGWSRSSAGLDSVMPGTIFIYPDPKWKWGGKFGWALGPSAAPYDGNHDIQFTAELLALAKRKYAVDPQRIFATGHSWGGDMAAVVGCFLGDQFKAIAPIAANRPYWFEGRGGPPPCRGKPAVWTFFGLSDDWFGATSPNGKFGREQNAFWRKHLNCKAARKVSGETEQFTTCDSDLRLTLYAPGQYSGGGGHRAHQPPDYFIPEISKWLMAF